MFLDASKRLTIILAKYINRFINGSVFKGWMLRVVGIASPCLKVIQLFKFNYLSN